MPVMRVRIADTEAIAKYYPRYKTVKVAKIVTLNYDGKGRRKISIDSENLEKLEQIIFEETQAHVTARSIQGLTAEYSLAVGP